MLMVYCCDSKRKRTRVIRSRHSRMKETIIMKKSMLALERPC